MPAAIVAEKMDRMTRVETPVEVRDTGARSTKEEARREKPKSFPIDSLLLLLIESSKTTS